MKVLAGWVFQTGETGIVQKRLQGIEAENWPGVAEVLENYTSVSTLENQPLTEVAVDYVVSNEIAGKLVTLHLELATIRNHWDFTPGNAHVELLPVPGW